MILVTGGLGYIGSHTCVALMQAGYAVTIVDNLANSKISVLERICSLGGSNAGFHQADLRDPTALEAAFGKNPIDAVIHFAGRKAVGESVEQPLAYYDNNIGGTLTLLKTMARFSVRRIVFSSSATVYGAPQRLPLHEDHPLDAVNPYGRTKQFVESVLSDVAGGDPAFRHATLRYFNPIGAHPSGRIGEDPRGIPNNLFPYITQVAIGRREHVRVFGDDYDTTDGTGVRDTRIPGLIFPELASKPAGDPPPEPIFRCESARYQAQGTYPGILLTSTASICSLSRNISA